MQVRVRLGDRDLVPDPAGRDAHPGQRAHLGQLRARRSARPAGARTGPALVCTPVTRSPSRSRPRNGDVLAHPHAAAEPAPPRRRSTLRGGLMNPSSAQNVPPSVWPGASVGLTRVHLVRARARPRPRRAPVCMAIRSRAAATSASVKHGQQVALGDEPGVDADLVALPQVEPAGPDGRGGPPRAVPPWGRTTPAARLLAPWPSMPFSSEDDPVEARLGAGSRRTTRRPSRRRRRRRRRCPGGPAGALARARCWHKLNIQSSSWPTAHSGRRPRGVACTG